LLQQSLNPASKRVNVTSNSNQQAELATPNLVVPLESIQ
jgi:hypothetical protein